MYRLSIDNLTKDLVKLLIGFAMVRRFEPVNGTDLDFGLSGFFFVKSSVENRLIYLAFPLFHPVPVGIYPATPGSWAMF